VHGRRDAVLSLRYIHNLAAAIDADVVPVEGAHAGIGIEAEAAVTAALMGNIFGCPRPDQQQKKRYVARAPRAAAPPACGRALGPRISVPVIVPGSPLHRGMRQGRYEVLIWI
jgi:hypothetical protein